ncbi:DUF2917 domain-containing protein [Herbaspirillum sp. WKF16]|uniref:DUF2917 domain-containing protein n=1 Tax=Herbaspirillum sp. WKF16 TaxID=3028312 RepID=UPI0023A978B6|nr:DUF2917 domain-containing protein [Herbaspirillum sp. WKF16]WDZ96167.1 DUF2917 domain-containing protein [Herbaspirillum sp. WKF16]
MQIPLSRENARLSLREGQTMARRLRSPVRVRVRCGLLWLTVERGGADVWLRPGCDFDFHGRGLAVFEAVKGCAEFEILPLPARQPCAAADCRPQPDAGAPRISQLLPHGLIRWF